MKCGTGTKLSFHSKFHNFFLSAGKVLGFHFSYWPLLGLWESIGTGKSAKDSLKCCYTPHSYVGAIFSRDKLLAQQCPPSRNGGESSRRRVAADLAR